MFELTIIHPAQHGHAEDSSTSAERRFVEPEDLICPGCGEQVQGAPP